jgi:ADP-ribose pyrophosphatase YjhB (NUDIX family)
MDITFKTVEGRFNYRVCAVIIDNNRILAMHDQRSPYYYLPGGRVKLHETAENAILRELKEELKIEARIIRPLWLNQSFFVEDVNNEKYHELCIYFLIDISKTNFPLNNDNIEIFENDKKLVFNWLKLDELESQYLYPLFIKKEIFNLPETLKLIVEYN